MRKILITLLALISLVFVLTSCSGSEPEFNFERCDADSYMVSITNADKVKVKTIVIPDTYDDLPVTKIATDAFYGCSRLLRVTIGENIVTIGKGAFYGASEVLEVYNRSSRSNDKIQFMSGIYGAEFVNEPFTTAFKQDSDGLITYEKDGNIYLVGYVGEAEEIVLPDEVTNIRPYAFQGSAVCKIIMPTEEIEVSLNAFKGLERTPEIVYINKNNE